MSHQRGGRDRYDRKVITRFDPLSPLEATPNDRRGACGRRLAPARSPPSKTFRGVLRRSGPPTSRSWSRRTIESRSTADRPDRLTIMETMRSTRTSSTEAVVDHIPTGHHRARLERPGTHREQSGARRDSPRPFGSGPVSGDPRRTTSAPERERFTCGAVSTLRRPLCRLTRSASNGRS